jgi:hypothetical protein
MPDYLASDWPPPLSYLSTRRRRYTLGAAIVAPIVLIGVLTNVHPAGPPDRGLAACTSLSGLNQAGVPDFRRLRAEFATSRWPDLRADGTAYADLAIKLRTTPATDGEQAVWSYQLLADTCAKHGHTLPFWRG